MRTIPLSGKVAAGRVALVDDEDYDLVMEYRWRVYERPASGKDRARGPYAVTSTWTPGDKGGKGGTLPMHKFLTGWPLTDHINHNGLDNRRKNLRPATKSQNGQNSRGRIVKVSRFKGVGWSKQRKMWQAVIGLDGKYTTLVTSPSEIECAYAYDMAAREMFGEFACTNFPEPPPVTSLEQWQAEHDERQRVERAERGRKISIAARRRYEAIEPTLLVCTICGCEYLSKKPDVSIYCSDRCGNVGFQRVWRARQKAKLNDGRLF
jgi:hypothetical protein